MNTEVEAAPQPLPEAGSCGASPDLAPPSASPTSHEDFRTPQESPNADVSGGKVAGDGNALMETMVQSSLQNLDQQLPPQVALPQAPPEEAQLPASLFRLTPFADPEPVDLDDMIQQPPISNSPGSKGERRPACDVLEDMDYSAEILGSQPQADDHPEIRDERPSAISATCALQDQEKMRIYVHCNGLTTVVSWPVDTSPQEVQKAVLCACDCIHGGGVQLLELLSIEDPEELQQLLRERQDEVGGKLVRVNKEGADLWYKRGLLLAFESFKESLKRDQLYLIESARERLELSDITGDHYRRLLLRVPALNHVEAQQAVAVLRRGANLIKSTRIEQQHFRFFQLSADLKRLLWYSGRKAAGDTTLNMSDIDEIKITRFAGGSNDGFPRVTDDKFYQHCSFSVITRRGQLQLCAKHEDEFDVWVTGLKALAAHFHDVEINKVQLLGHSRRFRTELERARDQMQPRTQPEDDAADHGVAIQGSMLARVKTREEARRQLKTLAAVLQKQKERILALRVDGSSSSISQAYSTSGEPWTDETANMSDWQLEQWQACKFVRESEAELKEVEQLLQDQDLRLLQSPETINAVERSEMLELVAQKLWEVNVNVENISDMAGRLSGEGPGLSLTRALNVIQERLEQGQEKLVESWKHFTENIMSSTVQKLRAAATTTPAEEQQQPRP